MEQIDMQISNEIAKDAIANERLRDKRERTKQIVIICLSILLLASMICGTYLAHTQITEQQYALNMQYSGMLDYLNRLETIDTGDNGIIYNNNEVGEDINHGSNNQN